MKWIGISGSWRTTCPELAVDLKREVAGLLKSGNGIVTGGALNVDYEATAAAIEEYPDGSRIKVILPTTLETYAKHYRQRAKEGVITVDQAERLIKQLERLKQKKSLIEMDNKVVDLKTYFERNTKVVEASDELLAFQVNDSQGVQDTIDKAKAKGIPVKIFRYQVKENQ